MELAALLAFGFVGFVFIVFGLLLCCICNETREIEERERTRHLPQILEQAEKEAPQAIARLERKARTQQEAPQAIARPEQKARTQQEAKRKAKEAKKATGTTLPTTTRSLNSQIQALMIRSSDLQIGKEVGRGGYGVVYKGKLQKHTTVAIKQLYPILVESSPVVLKEFAEEAKLMAGLRHPNVTLLYGVCQEPKLYCIVMEYVSNGSLYDFLKKSAPISSLCYKIAVDITKGLVYLHSKDIIHRDLKSPNILLDINHQAKISDLGLAKVKSGATINPLMSLCGTPVWMAPEQLRGEGSSKQSDVYSYGVILWEIATKNDPCKVNKEVPQNNQTKYANLIRRCWLERNNRPTAEQALKELRQNKEEIKNQFHHT
jgi:serine/threonine protein kinase